MQIISAPVVAQIEQKGSKFIAYLEPCADIRAIRERQSQLRALHPKAVHVVYAARVLGAQLAEDFSDDGEPKGSSAAPMLNVLRGAEIINAQAHVVRYFGGVKLGIGGLVRAYSAALNAAIASAANAGALEEFISRKRYFLRAPYELWRRCEYLLAGFNYSAEYGEQISATLELSDAEAAALSAELEKLRLNLSR